MQYWIIQKGESKGPFTLEELKALNISENTKIWCKDYKEWTYAKDTDIASELFTTTDNATETDEDTAKVQEQPVKQEEASEKTNVEPPTFNGTAPSTTNATPPPVNAQEIYRNGYNQGYYDGRQAEKGEDRSKCPPTHLLWVILTMVLCCLPISIIAMIYSTKVQIQFARGDYDAAKRSSDRAAYWSLASAIIYMVTYPILLALTLTM